MRWTPKLTEIGGDTVEGAYFSNHYSVDDPSPAVQQFVAAYRKKYGANPDSIAALSYDAARLLADAIRRAGSTEGKRMRDALAETKDFSGVSGMIKMDADRNPIKPAVVLKVEGGRFRFVTAVSPKPGQ
jgi:branched-chain amino acid transport system substrate-binding protein